MKKNKGLVLVEFGIGALAWLFISSGLLYLLRDWWIKVYAKSESYFIARSRLYKNNDNCEASSLIENSEFISRSYHCKNEEVHLRLKLSRFDYEQRLLLRSW